MRLTLRMLLDYLDEALDPQDAEEVERRIREKEPANKLAHRIRNVTRRLRLGAPRVSGVDMDANTVAQYLDFTLPVEQVQDFERVCLESDLHLAEVAASHSITTLLMRESVEVSPELRQRIYQLGPPAVTDEPADASELSPAMEATGETEQSTLVPEEASTAPEEDVHSRPDAHAPGEAPTPLSPATASQDQPFEHVDFDPSQFAAMARQDSTADVPQPPALVVDGREQTEPQAEGQEPPRLSQATPPPAPKQERPRAKALARPASSPSEEVALPQPPGPEFLRRVAKARWLPLGLTLMMALLLVATTLLLVGPLDETHPVLGGLFGGDAPDRTARAEPSRKTLNSANDPGEAPAQPNEAELDAARPPEAAVEKGSDTNQDAGSQPQDAPAKGAENSAAVPETTRPASEAIRGNNARANNPKTSPPAGSTTDAETGGNQVAASQEPSQPTNDLLNFPIRDPGESMDLGLTEKTRVGPDGQELVVEDEGAEPETAQAPQEPGVGRFSSEHEVLVRQGSEGWQRVEPRAPVESGDRLVALPSFRPQLLLAPNLQVTLIGPTELVLGDSGNPAFPRLELGYGQLLAFTHGKAGGEFELKLGERQGQLILEDPGSTFVVERRFVRPAGSDPILAASPDQVDLIAKGGRLAWREAGKTYPIPPDHVARLTPGGNTEVVPLEKDPAWLLPRELSFSLRSAAQHLETFLTPNRSTLLSFQELVEHHRVEIRSLALESLALLGEFDGYINAFEEVSNRSYWDRYFEVLRDAIARGPAAANRVQAALGRRRPELADTLWKLLCGYSDTELEEGADRRLVELLEHDQLVVRILALENLRRITNKTHLYRPEDPQPRPINEWKKDLKTRSIRYATQRS